MHRASDIRAGLRLPRLDICLTTDEAALGGVCCDRNEFALFAREEGKPGLHTASITGCVTTAAGPSPL